MSYKILKCIPSLLSHGAVAQAANMINVVKASFEITQDYKEEVCGLPQHFITLMYDLYKDAMYTVSESAIMGHDKDQAIISAEQYFIEKSDKVTKVLNNKAKILEALRKDMSTAYDKAISDQAKESKLTTLEESEKDITSVTGSVTTASKDDTVQKMVEYVKLLAPEKRLALIYALGITNMVDVKGLTTASITSDSEEAFAPEDSEISSQELEEKIKADPDKFGIYSISEIKEKLKEAMLSHQFVDDKGTEIEHDTLYTVVENISDKTIDELQKEVKEKLGLEDSFKATDLESLLDYLDESGEKLTQLVETPAHVIFTVIDDGICMVGAFNEEDASKLLSTASEDYEEEGEEEESNSPHEEEILQIIDENFDELQDLGNNDARLKWFKSAGDSIPADEIREILANIWRR